MADTALSDSAVSETPASEKFKRATPRPEKVAVVTEVRDRLSTASAAILTEYRGLTVAELARLRDSVVAAGGQYRVFKNTLVRRAATELGNEGLVEMLVGPTAIAFVDGDPVAVAKSLREFSRGNPNLVVKGGLLGDRILSAADTNALADVAPREVVLAQLAGAIAAPLRQMAGLLQALPRNLAYGLSALVDQKRASEPETEAADPAAVEPEAPDTEAVVVEPQVPAEPETPAEAPSEPEAPEAPTAPEPSEEPAEPAAPSGPEHVVPQPQTEASETTTESTEE